jgi:hypothetical protein
MLGMVLIPFLACLVFARLRWVEVDRTMAYLGLLGAALLVPALLKAIWRRTYLHDGYLVSIGLGGSVKAKIPLEQTVSISWYPDPTSGVIGLLRFSDGSEFWVPLDARDRAEQYLRWINRGLAIYDMPNPE